MLRNNLYKGMNFMDNNREQKIKKLIEKQETAWNQGIAKLYSEDFDSEGTFTNIRGETYFGQTVFENVHERIFNTFFKGSQAKMEIIRLHFPGKQVAIADLDVHLTNFPALPPNINPPSPNVIHTHLLEVFLLKENVWKMVVYHNVDVKFA
jgi:uncharacterized protein (TIGR02246 family)